MTEPWQIHVCPVHGQRTPNVLGDCPVGCCDAVMEVVPVVRDTRGDGVDVLRHWLAYADKEKPPLAVSPVWAGSEESAEKWREIGARVEGPFVLESAGAVSDAETGRALIDRMFELPRGPEWEQALAELRVWSMKDHNPGGSPPRKRRSNSPAAGRRSRRLRPGSCGASTRSARNPRRAVQLTRSRLTDHGGLTDGD